MTNNISEMFMVSNNQEIQIKTVLRYFFLSQFEWQRVTKQPTTNARLGVKKMELSFFVDMIARWCSYEEPPKSNI